MVFWRCCCRRVENQVDGRASSGHRQTSPRGGGSPRKSNNISHDDDFDSDVQAVKYMRERRSQSKDDEDSSRRSKTKQQKSPEQHKRSPSSAMRQKSQQLSQSSPIETDGTEDVEMVADDTSCIALNMDNQMTLDPPPNEIVTANVASDEEDATSDVDEATLANYDRAVHLLHVAMLEKQNALTSAEVEFLLKLVGSFDDEEDREESSSGIEHATLALDDDTLVETFALPSPSRTTQRVLPPRRPSSRGDKLSVVQPLCHSSSGGEAFELMIAKSASSDHEICDMDVDERDDPPLHTEDEPHVGPSIDAPGQEQPLLRYDGWEDDDEDNRLPFYILGQSSANRPHVLTPLVLEALRGFLPFVTSEDNFWLKFSLVRDGASLATLLHMVRASKWIIIGVETMEGEVFGSCTGTPWRKRQGWYGTGEAFLFRLKKSRLASPEVIAKSGHFDNKMEVYPYTGSDGLVQHCSGMSLAVGGGEWKDQDCPYSDEPTGIGLMLNRELELGETNSCATFANPRLCHRTNVENIFSISNVEAWTMTPCRTADDAEKLELHKLFVEEQRVQ